MESKNSAVLFWVSCPPDYTLQRAEWGPFICFLLLFSGWFIFFAGKHQLKTQKLCSNRHQATSYKDTGSDSFQLMVWKVVVLFWLLAAFQPNLHSNVLPTCSRQGKLDRARALPAVFPEAWAPMSARLLACFAFYSSELFFEFQEIGEVHVLKKRKKSMSSIVISSVRVSSHRHDQTWPWVQAHPFSCIYNASPSYLSKGFMKSQD